MKQRKLIFALKVFSVLVFVVAVFSSGFLFLDKIIIPKYFGRYNIYGVGDLIGVVSSLYDSPDEKTLTQNGYTDDDLASGVEKLQSAGYKIEDDGTISEENIPSFKGSGRLELSDREFSAICNKLLQSGILESALPELKYINLINITIIDLIVTPDETSVTSDGKTYESANIKFIVKINTDDIREQISLQMQTPEALLKMILPSDLYFTVEYNIDLREQGDFRSTGSIAINGKTAKQSEILVNLLIEFIFPDNADMNIQKFAEEIGNVALRGIDTLGEFSFSDNIDGKNQNGIVIS